MRAPLASLLLRLLPRTSLFQQTSPGTGLGASAVLFSRPFQASVLLVTFRTLVSSSLYLWGENSRVQAAPSRQSILWRVCAMLLRRVTEG